MREGGNVNLGLKKKRKVGNLPMRNGTNVRQILFLKNRRREKGSRLYSLIHLFLLTKLSRD